MQRVTAILRLIPVCLTAMAALMWSSSGLAQQSVEENIRPVRQICLAGQPCVGTTNAGTTITGTTINSSAANTATVAAPVSAPPPVAAAAAAAPVVEQAVAEVAFDPAASYQMSCFACHGSGAAGAPKLGDKEAWAARLDKGMDAVMAIVTTGLNAMPPKGMCMTCSDDNLRAIVDYMINQ